MNKLRKGDQVIVTTGRDKGKKGEITQVLADRVVVAGVNTVKKHVRPNPAKQEQGGIVSKEMPLHISNVAILNPSTQKADKVGIQLQDGGRKQRVFKSTGTPVGA